MLYPAYRRLLRQEALRELRAFGLLAPTASISQNETLPTFIAGLHHGPRASQTLQYVTATSVMTAYVPEDSGAAAITFATPDPVVAETLRALGESTSTIVLGTSDIPKTGYDAIVCQPPVGRKTNSDEGIDGFGGEVVRELAPLLNASGTLYWVTARAALWAPPALRTLERLQAAGLNLAARIDVASGAFAGTSMTGIILALRHETAAKVFVGALRGEEGAESLARALLAGPTRKPGASWLWLDRTDARTFADIERERLLADLSPRGRHSLVSLQSLLKTKDVTKADRPLCDENVAAAFLFVPEYSGSRATADLETQTVKPKAVYRLAIDPAKANTRFLAQLLNSPYGRHLRDAAAQGATIQRTSAASLLAMELPIPDIATQDRIARIDSDIGLLRASFGEMQTALDRDWTGLTEVAEAVEKLKAVLDIERQIADWWRELPYPLATIYRRYQVSMDPTQRLETLLHFFELAAVYLATLGASHVRTMREDWQQVLAKWLHPVGAAGIQRADFGFWINLAGASLKDTSRISSDKDLRASAVELVGPELVQVSSLIGPLGKATEALDVARRYRNAWKGHGGHVKPSDATKLIGELQQPVRDFYEVTAHVFRRLLLVRPGLAEVTDAGFKFEIEKLVGSDPTFERVQVALDRPSRTNSLAFWLAGARTMCRTLPFLRLGIPQQPQETSVYVYNRVESGGCRWISYQEAREQEYIAPDDELQNTVPRWTVRSPGCCPWSAQPSVQGHVRCGAAREGRLDRNPCHASRTLGYSRYAQALPAVGDVAADAPRERSSEGLGDG